MDKELHEGNLEVVNCTIGTHLIEAALCFFHFQFLHFLTEVVWAFQKLTKTGDFGPNGYFAVNGYLDKNGNSTSTKST